MGNNIILDTKQMINSMHNDIRCLSLDNAVRPCDRCWFTSKQIQEWSGMKKTTLNRRLEKLASVGRIVGLGDTNNVIVDINSDGEPNVNDTTESTMSQKPLQMASGSNLSLTPTDIRIISIEDSCGVPHEMKIYNLNVLNQLAMIEYENEKLNAISNKFSDILSEVETTGSYGVKLDRKTQLQITIMNSEPRSVEQLAAIAELGQIYENEKRALEDKTKELEAENEDLKNTNDELLTENELIRGNYYNTKQIYEILKRDYPEALQQAESTNYNKLRKGLCDITNEKRQGRKVYKKHVKNDKGETEWRQEYYFERNILDTILERVKDSIRYIFNIRLR